MSIGLRNFFRIATAFVIFTIVFVIAMNKIIMPWYVKHGKEVEMLNVIGKEFPEAEAILTANGFEVTVIDTLKNTDKSPGTVIDQIPNPGKKVKRGRVVKLVIAGGKIYHPMPRVVGKPVDAARLELEKYHIAIDTVYKIYSSIMPEGVVTDQSTKPGYMIAEGSKVKLWVSLGPPAKLYRIPDLIGMNLNRAKEEIKKEGLTIGNIRYIPTEEFAPFTVLDQNPAPKKVFENPVSIELEVSTIKTQ